MNRPQEDHCDLGLIEDDNTPDMRKAPAVAPADANAQIPNHQEKIVNNPKSSAQLPFVDPVAGRFGNPAPKRADEATTQISPWIVREKGVDTEWLADEVVTVDGDSDTGWVEFIAVADRDFDVEIVTELWVTPQYGATIKLGHQPHQWHAALDALTKVVAALDAAYAEKDA